MVTSISSDVRRENVINNPHIVDWFFTQRLQNFIKHWLYDSGLMLNGTVIDLSTSLEITVIAMV